MPEEQATVEEKTGTQEAETAETKPDAAEAQAEKAIAAKMENLGIPDSDAEPAQEAAGETDKDERKDEKAKADEADSKVAEPAKAEETDEDKPETPTLTASQRETAKQLGYTDEDLTGMGEHAADVLDRAGDRLRRKMSEIGSNLAESQTAETKPKGEGGKTGASDAPPEIEFTDADLDGDGDITVKLNQLATENKRLASEVAELKTDRQDEKEAEIERNVDTFFAGLGDEFTELFGKGPLAELDEDSAECKARVRVMDKAAPLRRAWAATGQSMSLEQSLNEGLAIVARDQIRATERKKLKAELDKRSRQRIAQPAGQQRASKTETDEERAARKIGEKAKALGVKMDD